MLSHVQLSMTPWTVACQAPLSMGFSWQEYWNGLPFLPPGNFSDPGIKPLSLTSVSCIGRQISFTTSTTREAQLLPSSFQINSKHIQLLHRFLSPN